VFAYQRWQNIEAGFAENKQLEPGSGSELPGESETVEQAQQTRFGRRFFAIHRVVANDAERGRVRVSHRSSPV